MTEQHTSARPNPPHNPDASAKKRQYQAPQLVIYGDVAQLTAGGVSGVSDHGANMMQL